MTDSKSDSSSSGHKIQLTVAIISVIGVLGGAFLANYQNIFGQPDEPPEEKKALWESSVVTLGLENLETVFDDAVTLEVTRFNESSVRLRSNLWNDEFQENKRANNCDEKINGDKISCFRNSDKGVHLNAPISETIEGIPVQIVLMKVSKNDRVATFKISIKK